VTPSAKKAAVAQQLVIHLLLPLIPPAAIAILCGSAVIHPFAIRQQNPGHNQGAKNNRAPTNQFYAHDSSPSD
jgi:hypothetical protein